MGVSTMPFYYATIEQYYTGELTLQEINGVDDGSIAYIAMCFFTAYVGSSFWKTKVNIFDYMELSFVEIIILSIAIGILFGVIQK